MYCRKLKNGKWSCTADASPDPLTGKRRQVTRRGDTKKEAQQRTRERIKELNSNSASNSGLTFQDVYDDWWDIYVTTVKTSTAKTKRNNSVRVLEEFGDIPIKNIQPRQIQLFFNDLASKYTSHHLGNIKGVLNQVLDYAVRADIIEKSPLDKILMPKGITRNKKRKFLEQSEVTGLLSTVKEGDLQHYVMIYCQLSTGMRVGEMSALQWSDIDFDEHSIYIDKTLYYPNMNGWQLLPPKTKSSNRVILVDQHLINLLKKYKALQNAFRLKYPGEEWDNDFVFTDLRNGNPLFTRKISKIYNKYYKLAGIEGVSGTHILRHTHITLLIESGVDMRSVMERVGHEKIDTTLEVYSHVTNKMKEKGLEKISETLSNIRANL